MVSSPLVPGQREDDPVIVGLGLGETVTVILEVPRHPFPSVTVTVYVAGNETETVWVVAPVDQI